MADSHRRPGDLPPATDDYLAAILDELRTIRRRLVQEPADPAPADARLVSEPGPGR